MSAFVTIYLTTTLIAFISLIWGAIIYDWLNWPFAKRKKNSGYYLSACEYEDEITSQKKQIVDILFLEIKGTHIKGRVFHSNDKNRIYTIYGNEKQNNIYTGIWKNISIPSEGHFIAKYIAALGKFEGYWMSTNNNSNIHDEHWVWEQKKTQNSFPVERQINFNKLQHKKTIKTFVKTLNNPEHYNIDYFGYLSLTVSKGIFNPSLGHVTKTFFNKIVKDKIEEGPVLDLFTGCGVYALYLAKKGVSNVVGIDISPAAIEAAQANAVNNNINNIDFRTGDLYTPLKPNEKFRYIIGNPPFSDPKYCKSVKKSDYYDSVCLPTNTLKEFILNSSNHLMENGELIFTFGSSGDIQYLEFLIQLSPYESSIAYKMDECQNLGETFYIYHLKLKKETFVNQPTRCSELVC
ncbi:MAG: methyltransferase [Bacteroidales bacterium]|nr:methyltransferase [Bacteroidales bacterium]